MHNSIDHLISKLAITFVNIPIIRNTLKPVYDKYKKHREKQRVEIFHKFGSEVLRDFIRAIESSNKQYYLAFGTLLGAVREHGFIRHDNDIDVMIPITEYDKTLKQVLEKYGFKLVHQYEVMKGETGFEQTYIKNNVGVDIFFIYREPKDESLSYCCDFMIPQGISSYEEASKKNIPIIARKIQIPTPKGKEVVQFENIYVSIPENAVEILEHRYGSDYMIPNPNWTIKSYDNHITVMKENGYVKCF